VAAQVPHVTPTYSCAGRTRAADTESSGSSQIPSSLIKREGMDVKVFISWSGEPSQSIARVLRDWLPTVVQHVEPWMSDEEIKSGTRWNEEVAKALDGTDFGIVCVTASNQHRPWLMFEAGALAKRLDVGQLVPLCINLSPAEVTGPLEAFQARCLDELGMRRLVQDMMTLREKPPAQAQIDQLFQAMWPALESHVSEAKQQSPSPQNPQRTTKEMLEELVDRVRRMEREYSPRTQGFVSSGFGVRASDTASATDEISPPREYFHPGPQ
jgi:hypothetical protein